MSGRPGARRWRVACNSEELLKCQELPAIDQWGFQKSRRISDEAIENDVPWLGPLHCRKDGLGGLAQFGLGRVEDRGLRFPGEVSGRLGKVTELDAVERPPVGGRTGVVQVTTRFGEGDIHAGLVGPAPAEGELQGNGRLARARVALDKIKALAEEASHQDVIQAGHPCGDVHFHPLVSVVIVICFPAFVPLGRPLIREVSASTIHCKG